MGKGGEAARAKVQRQNLAVLRQKAQERSPLELPKFSIKDVRNAIPAHCFQRSLVKSFAYLVADLLAAVALFCFSQAIDSTVGPGPLRLALWCLYWVAQGVVCTGIWVISHECGHGAFSDYPVVNDTVGFVFHSLLLVPYFSWKYSHRRHHSNTGSIDKDEVFVPKQGHAVKNGPWAFTAPGLLFNLALTTTLGWPLYLIRNAAGRPYPRFACHFDPWSPIFNDRERLQVAVSDVGLLAVVLGLGKLAQTFGVVWVLKVYGVPYVFVNFWLVMITLLQHTHPALAHYDSNEWEWLRGALSTVDRNYGILNIFHHHIADTHVCHHLFSTLPHYHAQEATEAIKPILGDYYKSDPRNIAVALWQDWKVCTYVAADPEGPSGVLWFRQGRPASSKPKSV